MTLPPSHILPSSAFRHIGFMVLFMSAMAGFCALALLAIQTITHSWITDTQNRMTIEIPAYDSNAEVVFDQSTINQNLQKIQNYLKGDPLILSSSIKQFDDDFNDQFTIPSPIFLTLGLHPERAEGIENRLISNIQRLVPTATIRTVEAWQNDINQTALTLRVAFGGLTLAVMVMTAIMLSATIRTQLIASSDTVQLIHLMGAESGRIAALFQSSILKPVIWGTAIGLFSVGLALSPMLIFLDITVSSILFYGALTLIFFSFVTLCHIVTFITVTNALRHMP